MFSKLSSTSTKFVLNDYNTVQIMIENRDKKSADHKYFRDGNDLKMCTDGVLLSDCMAYLNDYRGLFSMNTFTIDVFTQKTHSLVC